jgi:transposase
MSNKSLATLIRRRDRLVAELAEIEPRIKEEIVGFSKVRGYLVSLRIEQVRSMLGMENSGSMH